MFEKTERRTRTQEERCCYFLLCIGEKGREIYKTLQLPPETETNAEGQKVWRRTTDELKTAFKNYCELRKNLTFERHKFNTRTQIEGETIDQYVTVLRTLASTCQYNDLKDGLIRDRIVCGIRNEALREHLLRIADLSLEKAIDSCRASEQSKQQLKSFADAKSANVDYVKKSQPRNKEHHTPKPAYTKRTCRNHERDHERRTFQCVGHFA